MSTHPLHRPFRWVSIGVLFSMIWSMVAATLTPVLAAPVDGGLDHGASQAPLLQSSATMLVATITATPSTFASDRSLSLTIEARDAQGNIDPSYRGAIDINPTIQTLGLPQGPWNSWEDYVFTEADAGRHVFADWGFTKAGTASITVVDRADANLTATTNAVTINPVFLHASLAPATTIATNANVALTVEARDANGNVVPGYRGEIDFTATTPVRNLPISGWFPAYRFTSHDAGRHIFPNLSMAVAGTHAITVNDRGDQNRTVTSNTVAVEHVVLSAVLSPNTPFASSDAIALVVEARDTSGHLVPEYRGGIDLTPTSPIRNLPESGWFPAYTFTAADAGRHVFSGLGIGVAGPQSVVVTDRDDQSRTATSNSITVQEVILSAVISPTYATAGEPILHLAVEARDQAGNLVPSYRGGLDFAPSTSTSQLPTSGWFPAYTFTAADAGRHVFSNWSFNTEGSHHLVITDRMHPNRTVTTNSAQIGGAQFRITFNSATMVARDHTLTMTIEVVDPQGNRIPGYRGDVDINPSGPTDGLYQSPLQGAPDHTFSAEDAGIHVFPNWGFTTVGDHTVTVIDRAVPSRMVTSDLLSVTLPPDPVATDAAPAPAAETIPSNLDSPEPIPYGWGASMTMSHYMASNMWQGYPKGIVPSGPGTRYVVNSTTQKGPWEWHYGTYYTCPYLGWENPPAGHREFGYGIGYLPYQDPTFTADAMDDQIQATTTAWCGGWSWYGNFDDVGTLGPVLSDPAGLDAQAAHINVQGGSGNAGGFVELTAQAVEDMGCEGTNAGEAVQVGDPIDTRSGWFHYTEHDLGITTGCSNIDLKFERHYTRSALRGGSFGPAWTHTYDQRLIPFGTLLLLQRPGGYALFQDVGGPIYAGVPGARQTLMKRAGGGWVLIHRDRRADVFDADGKLIAQQDPNGNLIWMTYQAYSREGVAGTRLARVDAPGGRYLWFGYDYYHPNRMIHVTDHTGRRIRFGYDAPGRLVSVTDALNQTSTYTYHTYVDYQGVAQQGGWLLKSKHDANGNQVFLNTFDTEGRVIHQDNNLGQSLTLSYGVISDTEGLMATTNAAGTGVPYPALLLTTTVTDETGLVTTIIYGSDGLVREITDSTGKRSRYRGYTTTRKPTIIEDALGRSTTYAYNHLGLVTKITDPVGESTFTSYDAWGQPTLITDTLGHTVHVTYDGPNVTAITGQGGRSITIAYEDQLGWNNRIKTINESGVTTTFGYNTHGEMISITDAAGLTTRVRYDSAGRLVDFAEPIGYTTTLQYDANDQVIAVTNWTSGSGQTAPMSRTTRLVYDPAGNLLHETNALSQSTLYQYNTFNLLIQQTLPNQQIIGFSYNDATGTSGITPPGRPEHRSIGMPLLGRYVPPALGSSSVETTFGYDLLGQLTHVNRPDGATLAFGYDGVGRTTAITQPHGILRVVYDHAGLPSVIEAPDGGVLTMEYDANGMPIGTRWRETLEAELVQHFNLHGQVTSQQINGTNPVSLSYDAIGRLTNAGGLILAYQQTTGLLAGTKLGLIHDGWNFNQFGEPTAYSATKPGGLGMRVPVYGGTYQYDQLGRIIRFQETLGSTAIYTYSYDPVGQLTSVYKNSTRVASYTYDPNGNRLTTTTSQGTVSATYDAQDRVSTWGNTAYTYTLNGELATKTLNGETTTYTYDTQGNVVTVALPKETTITYVHDGLNRRIGKQVNGVVVQRWLYADGLNPIAELDADGRIVAQFIYGTQEHVPDAMIKNGQTYRILTDHRGSPRIVINTANATIAQRIDYDPWGAVILDTNPGFQPFGFAGGRYDPDTTLTRFGARDYDATIGRWTAKDPIGWAGGDTNLYRYVGNDPINLIDPTGERGIGAALRKAGKSTGGRRAAAGLMLGLKEASFGLGLQLMLNGFDWECVDWGDVTVDFAIGAMTGGGSKLKDADKFIPDEAIVVRGGTSDLPPSGTIFSGSYGSTLDEAASGVPHGQIRTTTAGQIRSGGGTIEYAPELTRGGNLNDKHVNICLGTGPCPFGPLEPNPVPKSGRIQ